MTTYPYGYNSPPEQLTAAQLDTKRTWARLHPEMKRRLLALFDAAQAAGKVLGVGEAARSAAQQRTVFLERHTVVASGGCCGYQGKRYQLKTGMAHAAPPGKSYHEDDSYEASAVAADLVGDLTWMRSQCARYGLVEFSQVNNEPWHVQPAEFPTARSQYAGQRLTVWALPQPPAPPPIPTPPVPPTPPTPEDTDMQAATLWRDSRYLNVFLIGSCPAQNVSPLVYDSLVKRGVPVIVETHAQLLETCLYQSGLDASDLVPA